MDAIEQIIDPKTGEIIEKNGTFMTKEEKDNITKYYQKQDYLLSNYSQYGGFVWCTYKLNELYAPELTQATLTRLIYLVTYANYNGTLVNTKDIPMTTQDIYKVMKLSSTVFKTFMKEVINKGYICETEDKYILSEDKYFKGKLSKRELIDMSVKNLYCNRLYNLGIRTIYKKSKPTQHKTLSTIFRILPYVNRDYNVVCNNPLETNLEDINEINPVQLCELIGYEKSNAARLIKDLTEPTFSIKGYRDTSMITLISHKYRDIDSMRIVINPCIYYAGNKWGEVKILGKF